MPDTDTRAEFVLVPRNATYEMIESGAKSITGACWQGQERSVAALVLHYALAAAPPAPNVAELVEALEECASELEAEINARAVGELPRRIRRDLKTVDGARYALANYRASTDLPWATDQLEVANARIERLEKALKEIASLTYDCAARDGGDIRSAHQVARAALNDDGVKT